MDRDFVELEKHPFIYRLLAMVDALPALQSGGTAGKGNMFSAKEVALRWLKAMRWNQLTFRNCVERRWNAFSKGASGHR